MSWWPNPNNHYFLDDIPNEEYEETYEPEDDPDLRPREMDKEDR